MNTIQKGDRFEKQIFDYLETELAKDNLFVPAKKSKIFLKKSYYSKDRDSNIITDISIETSLANAADYSLLTVIECKDYVGYIQVAEIEEFHAKVQQISGVNVKAVFITTAALQKSALKFAKSKKIGIIRFLPPSQVDWASYSMALGAFARKSSSKISDCDSAFLQQNYKANKRYFFGCIGDRYISSLFDFLEIHLNDKL